MSVGHRRATRLKVGWRHLARWPHGQRRPSGWCLRSRNYTPRSVLWQARALRCVRARSQIPRAEAAIWACDAAFDPPCCCWLAPAGKLRATSCLRVCTTCGAPTKDASEVCAAQRATDTGGGRVYAHSPPNLARKPGARGGPRIFNFPVNKLDQIKSGTPIFSAARTACRGRRVTTQRRRRRASMTATL